MYRKSIVASLVLIVLVVSFVLSITSSPAIAQDGTTLTGTPTLPITPTPTLDPNIPASYRVEKVLDANFPIALDWTPDGRMFYTERFSGYLRVVDVDGTLQTDPVWSFPVSVEGERGLLGMAISPDYDDTGYIYVYYTRVPGDGYTVPVNRIVRLKEEDGVGSDPEVMLDIPLTTNNLWHQGGNIHFGPDGMLYLAIGEYYQPRLAQNVDAVPGKINRFEVTDNGLVPASDNPFVGSATFAYGLRNPFDFDFDPYTASRFQIVATDNGPDCDDELNIIVEAGNYGWRESFPCDDSNPQSLGTYNYPIWHITPTEAPTGVAMYTEGQIPQWAGQVFFCSWLTGKMRRVVLDPSRTMALSVSEVDLQGNTCQIEVEMGPDGALYFTNQRAIYRIVAE